MCELLFKCCAAQCIPTNKKGQPLLCTGHADRIQPHEQVRGDVVEEGIRVLQWGQCGMGRTDGQDLGQSITQYNIPLFLQKGTHNS